MSGALPLRTIRLATPAHLPAILRLAEEARGIMRSSGNVTQWVNGYPSASVILSDISRQGGYLVCDDEVPVAYFAFLPGPEPTYAHIDGRWLSPELPYHVIHRVASTSSSHGVMRAVLDFAFSQDPNIRIDTHAHNGIMLHILEQEGFSFCGVIHVHDGTPRHAYQRVR